MEKCMIKIQYENMAMHTTFSAIIVSSSTKSFKSKLDCSLIIVLMLILTPYY